MQQLRLVQRSRGRGQSLIASRAPHRRRAFEDVSHGIVISRWNRIVFVIVITRAGDAQPHDPRTHHTDLIRDHIHVEVRAQGIR